MISPADLDELVCLELGIDPDPFPSEVTSVFGQRIPIQDAASRWVDKIRYEHIGYGEAVVPWRSPFHPAPLLEWIIRRWVIERIQLRIDVRPAKAIAALIGSLSWQGGSDDLEAALGSWLLDVAQAASMQGQPDTVTGARLLYRWCLEEDLPNFSEHRADELDRVGQRRRSGRELVTLRDPVTGPLTIGEIAEIQRQLIVRGDKLIRERALFLICRDWGLRPIQLSLLRVSDYGEDELGPFLLVPSVKGIRRSRLRRNPTNMVKRHIADDTTDAVRRQIAAAAELVGQLTWELEQEFPGSADTLASLDVPLFPQRRSSRRAATYLADAEVTEYIFHGDSMKITDEFRAISNALQIPARSDALTPEGATLVLTAYRLRRAKATTMVMSGCSPEEVAEALDHQSIDTVAHYFRYSRDLHDYINSLHDRNEEIARAVAMWSGRLEKSVADAAPDAVPVGSIGTCTLGTVCPYHPIISCYTCHSFRPSVNGDHKGALRTIELLQQQVRESSTGPVQHQLRGSLTAATALVRAIEAQLINE